ncbi:hypothetical protein BH09ACT12_BH09ACT12_02430 [soil metagenome]
MSADALRRPALRQLVLTMVLAACGAVVLVAVDGVSAEVDRFPAATPAADCGPGSRPETGVQGRVPSSDYASGRAARGYRCNTRKVGHQGSTGGFKVLRYTDRRGNTCAYYDSTRTFPADILEQAQSGLGVVVLNMTRPRAPRVATTLTTPTMLSPHESLLVNERRGLLAAVMGNPFAGLGLLEIYDVHSDCRHPRLLSRTPQAILGHESGWSPDGLTFYGSSSGGNTLVALDVSDPSAPTSLVTQVGVNYHGMRLSDDGRTMYVANIGNDLSGATLPGEGLRILDVSEIQDREPDPQIHTLSDLTWRESSIPQVAQPFRRGKRDYVLQVDEFSRYGYNAGSVEPKDAAVGAARVIDVTDPRAPRIVSRLRLGVQQPKARIAADGDPGASTPLGGYTAHYCSVPTRDDPRLVACSMIGSGLRIFDISKLAKPREVAYYNQPSPDGAAAYAQPAWDIKHRSVWYTDGNAGFFAIRLTNGVGRLLRR